MKAMKLLMAVGAAALILAASSGAEASERRGAPFAGSASVAAQAGPANVAGTRQQGANNSAAILQTGSGNIARTFQRGNGNNAEIVQTGNRNRGVVIQIGDGQNAALDQTGGQRTNVIQVNRGGASVDIRNSHRNPFAWPERHRR